jgi:hypothetical protein
VQGPRGTAGADGDDSYENLILLCPTHHTLVDKAPQSYPADLMLSWKRNHETRVASALSSPSFQTLRELYAFAKRRLAENEHLWKQFGPESTPAANNMLSSSAQYWMLRKLDTVCPNNRRIINAFLSHESMVPEEAWREFVRFKAHAEAFEASAYERGDRDAVPRFPKAFAEALEAGNHESP